MTVAIIIGAAVTTGEPQKIGPLMFSWKESLDLSLRFLPCLPACTRSQMCIILPSLHMVSGDASVDRRWKVD